MLVADGQVYDRDSISQWFRISRTRRSPNTGLSLPILQMPKPQVVDLIPVAVLKNFVERYLRQRPELAQIQNELREAKEALVEKEEIMAQFQEQAELYLDK